MTRRDYEKFAAVIREDVNAWRDKPEHRVRLEYAADVAARVFTRETVGREPKYRFDKARFLKACGLE